MSNSEQIESNNSSSSSNTNTNSFEKLGCILCSINLDAIYNEIDIIC